MIRPIHLEDNTEVLQLLELQLKAYRVEAERIGFADIPPLRDTIQSLQSCEETFLGWWEPGDTESSYDQLIGAISYEQENGEVTICRLMVHPGHFRKGIASRLLQAIFDTEPGAVRYAVSTGAANEPAIRLYLGHGFRKTGERLMPGGVPLAFFVKPGIDSKGLG